PVVYTWCPDPLALSLRAYSRVFGRLPPCVRIEHLSETEQRVLRLAVNRLGENGEWNLDELKIEFEELIVADAPIEASGFALDEIDRPHRPRRGRRRGRRGASLARG